MLKRTAALAFAVLLLSPLSALAYSGSAAASYADQYATSYNPLYPSFANKGGDCANFVSQALFAGGIAQRPAGTYSGTAAWYMTQTRKSWSYSTTWINAQSNSVFLLQHLPGVTTVANVMAPSPTETPPSNAIQGDVVFYDWNNDGTFDHESIITTADGQYVDAHTNNRFHAFWTLAPYNSDWMTTHIVVLHIPQSTT
jgi:putative amidase-like protein